MMALKSKCERNAGHAEEKKETLHFAAVAVVIIISSMQAAAAAAEGECVFEDVFLGGRADASSDVSGWPYFFG
jgi:hypothetical protein